MRSACSFRLQPEALCQPEAPLFLLILFLTLAGCGAATSWTKDDPSISTHVKIALLNDSQVAPYRIDAKTSGGVVTLTGTVKTQAELDRALDVARKVKGVRDVRSELRVGS